MSFNEAVAVIGLGKCYQVYAEPHDRLKQFLYPRLQSFFGKDKKKYYEEFWALRGISFCIQKGETVGIIGSNGSGKSTLLQMICGTLNPTEGSVSVNGRVAALLELGSGFNPEFTGRENVYLNAAVLGLSREEINEKFDQIEEFADIGDFIDRPVKTYSSGMYVRLAFAVVAHVDADVLIIDEALAVGDAFFTQKCMRFLRDFKARGTLVFVSHDTAAVVNLCDKVVWIDRGKLIAVGDPKEISEDYLASLYERRGGGAVKKKGVSKKSGAQKKPKSQIDSRWEKINNSNLKNVINVFSFNERSDVKSFGAGKAEIERVCLQDLNEKIIHQCVGGEDVDLLVFVKVLEPISEPIVGFSVKDRLGQVLFGDNTYLTYMGDFLSIEAGRVFFARFRFQMPILPIGDYSVAVAVATGTQMDHQQQHWIHDALVFKSISSSVSTGLVGLPMHEIEMNFD